jgi:general secretion pathway protein F/type IV pilus assembly protein PilC
LSLSSRTLSRWYAQLATNLEAGLPLQRSVETLPGPPLEKRRLLADRLAAGDPVPDALERGAAWIPTMDRKVLSAGAASGRLPDVCKRLSARHEESFRAGARVLLAAAYPMFVSQLAAFAFPVGLLFDGSGVAAYLTAVLKVIIPIWLAIGILLAGVRWRFRPVLFILDLLPLVGGFRRRRAIADLAFVLEIEIVAGIRIDIAWLQAAMAAGDRRLEPLAVKVADAVQRGETVSSVLIGKRILPEPFADFYHNGEQTGKLDESLAHIHRHFQEGAMARLKIATIVYPNLLFGAVAVWVVIKVLSFYLGYFRQIEELM